MTSNRFFIKKENIHYPHVTLYGPEHYHLSRVARVKPNNKVWLFSEKGASFLTKVIDISPAQTKLVILEEHEQKPPHIKIFLAQALLKAKSMDLVIKKSTELGVMSIIPVVTKRTVVRIDEKIEKKVERWKKLVIEASKQCGRSTLPEVSAPVRLSDLLEKRAGIWCLYLSENGGTLLRDIIFSRTGFNEKGGCLPESIILLVGPEGGWTAQEEEALLKTGFEAGYLGENILRAETAAISSLAILSHFWNS